MSNLVLIDKDTGEVIHELEDGDRLIKKRSIEELESTVKIEADFIKLIMSNIMPVLRNLQDTKGKVDYKVMSLMFYLMQFLSYKSGLLQHINGKPLTNDYIINNSEMNRTDVYRCLKILREKQIIAIVQRENALQYYMFNPFIAFRGMRVDQTTIDVFNDTVYNTEQIKIKNK